MAKIIKISLLFVLFIALLAASLPAANVGTQSAFGKQPFVYHFPLFLNQNYPATSTSYYMTSLNTDLSYRLGCQLGTRDKNTPGAQNSVAVLAFGYPRCFSGGGYGANLFGYGPATLDNVSTAVKYFALGYYTCTGSDNKSNLVVGVGTSNYLGSTEPCNTHAKARAHGTAWSAMVREINQWAVTLGIFHQVQVYGANDIEVGWNSPAWSRAWVTGFDQVSGNFMLHFGDAAGCPYEDRPYWPCGTSTYPEWTLEDVWYVSYGAPSALPLPLIYLTTGVHAKQWAYLSQYSVAKHGYSMDFTGVFTQWQYCQQFSWCNTTDNTPEAAHQQLTYELNKSPTTAQDLRWKTDIRWIMQNEVTAAGSAQDDPGDEAVVHPALERADALDAALEAPAISTELRSSLESKQSTYQTMADMVAISSHNPAPKDGQIFIFTAEGREMDFVSGIIENGEIPGLPYGVEIINVWQAQTDQGYLQIGAGASPQDAERGALYLVLGSPDKMTFQSALIEAPEGCGPLAILSESEGQLEIQSIDECLFMFDLSTWNLTATPD